MSKHNPDQPKKKLPNTPASTILRYTNVAFQMIVIIVAGSLGGVYLDQLTELAFPVYTVVGTVLSVFAAVYISIKEFLKK
ncbi:MAG: AtpZ/AtpI family protein [Bacteroidota bacterium]